MVHLRAVILAADAKITEQIKWKAPSFCYHGDDRVTMRLYPPDRIQLVFHRGAKVKDATTFMFEDRSGLHELVGTGPWARSHSAACRRLKAQRAALVEIVQRWMHATT